MIERHIDEGLRKLTFSDQFAPDVEVGMQLVEDTGVFDKTANVTFDCTSDSLKPDKEHVGIHAIALGDFEHYGMNRNGDGFPKKACQTRHDTFVTHGNVFIGHNNRDRSQAVGQIVKSAYNEPMGRIQLFLHVHKDKARDQLHKLATTGEHSFSMACTRAGTPIVTSCGTKAIEDIEPGDLVLTHTGNWKPAVNRSARDVDEYMRVRLVSWGRTDLEITGNHEVLAARFEDIPSTRPLSKTGHRLSQARRANRYRLYKTAKWTRADALTPLHYMLVPIDREESSHVSVNWARVLGYYIAEGAVGSGVTLFTCHMDDAAVQELPGLAAWTGTTIVPKRNCDAAVTVHCYGTELMRKIDEACGHPGVNKRLPLDIQHADAEAKLNFMAAWFNEDGWQDKDGLHWSTHYQNLSIDLQRLLASCDIPSSCVRIDHLDDRGIVCSEDAVEYVVTISNEFSNIFCDISKAGLLDMYGRTKCRTFITGDYLCVPVASVEPIHETVKVYNFSVADDESYTVYGLAVHNCRVPFDRCEICNTLRKSAADPNQCEHIRDNLGMVFSDGKVACTQNDYPTWFDMSFVKRPADRIAWNLKVAMANGTVDAVKQAESSGLWVPDELEYSVPGYESKLRTLTKLAALETKYMELFGRKASYSGYDRYLMDLTKAAACDPSDEQIDQLRTYSPEQVFAKLAECGVLLSAPAFYKFALGTDYGALVGAMPEILEDVRSGLFTRLYKQGGYQRTCRNTYFDVDTRSLHEYCGYHNSDLHSFIGTKLAQADTFVGPGVEARIIEATIYGRQPAVRMPTCVKIASASIVHRGAEIYGAYKLSALNAMDAYHKQANTDVLLALATVQNPVK
jgi:hypothetical protein